MTLSQDSVQFYHPASVYQGPFVYPSFPPPGWNFIQKWGDGFAFQKNKLRAIIDATVKADGRPWLHISYSKKDWLPSWDETKLVWQDFIGDNVALIILPRSQNYVNIHQNCLHLWHCITGDPVPDMTEGTEENFGFKSI